MEIKIYTTLIISAKFIVNQPVKKTCNFARLLCLKYMYILCIVCIWTLNINGRLDKLVPESVKFAQLLTSYVVLAWQKLVLRQDIIIMKTAVPMLQIDLVFMYNN